jgi:hypothetical protein
MSLPKTLHCIAYAVFNEDKENAATTHGDNARELAREIVRRWNTHEAMKAALDKIHTIYRQCDETQTSATIPGEVWDEARAALELAKGTDDATAQ